MKISIYMLSVIVLLLSACAEHKPTPDAGLLNAKASLPADFNFSKMGLKVITSTVNKKAGTMSTLYGNDAAHATAQTGTGKCLPGTVFALITWRQQPDKRWIGGKIPANLLSVEMLNAQRGSVEYTRYKGADLKADVDTTGRTERTNFMLGLKPSPMF